MLETGVAFLAGLLAGSFLNVCIYRLPRNRSVVRPRSYCPRCRTPIAWYDNIPVLSYLLLRGRCRHCRERISLRYPVVELLTGVLFAAIVHLYGPGLEAVKWCVFAGLLLALAVTDLGPRRILPDELTVGGIVAGVGFAVAVPMDAGLVSMVVAGVLPGSRWTSLAESLFGAGFTAAVLWLIGWLYQKMRKRTGLGFGDVKLVAMMGAFLGVQQTLWALMVGSVAGALIGSAYILAAGKDPGRFPLPYGTFLAGAGIAYGCFGRLYLSC